MTRSRVKKDFAVGIDDNATSTAITIDSSGNVGIGATTPSSLLTIRNDSTVGTDVEMSRWRTASGGNLRFYVSDLAASNPEWRIESNASEPLYLSNAGSGSTSFVGVKTAGLERMRIDSEGNVGIGETNPAQALVVRRSTGNAYLDVARATQSQGQVALQLSGGTGGTSWIMYQSGSSDDLRFYGDGSDRMTLTSEGKLGIGTTGPAFPLDIRAPSGGGDAVLRVHNQHTGSGDDAILRLSIAGNTADSIIQFGDTNDSDVGRIAYHHNGNTMRFFTGADEEMRLENDGDLHVENSVIGSSSTVSDERFKDDVTTITGALDTVDSLRGVTFTWNTGKNTGQTDYGFIAQEVEQVIPEIVRDKKLPLFASDEDTLYKTVDYAKVCVVLVEAVSELRAEVRSLETRLSALEAN